MFSNNMFSDPFFSRPSSLFSHHSERESPFTDPFFTHPSIREEEARPASAAVNENPAAFSPGRASQTLANFPFPDDDFGRSFGPLVSRWERLMDRMEHMPHFAAHQLAHDPNAQHYSSSSSYSSQSNGNEAATTVSSKTETRRVGNMVETKSSWKDSQGNERTVERRQLGDKTHEVIEEKNGKGEKRSHENLKQIAPEKVNDFHKQWEVEKKRLTSWGEDFNKDTSATLPPAGEQKKLH